MHSAARRTCHTNAATGGSINADGIEGWHVVGKDGCCASLVADGDADYEVE